jgi:DNA ligase-1
VANCLASGNPLCYIGPNDSKPGHEMANRSTNDDSRLQHGQDWAGQDLTGWLLTEKLDGCRAYWTGAELITRSGARIAAPAHITAWLPQGVALDGELWAGRGQFETARRAVQQSLWADSVRFVVFDAPHPTDSLGLRRLAAERHVRHAQSHGFNGHLLRSEYALSTEHALGLLKQLLAAGAEGLMAQDPRAAYRPGRGAQLLKLKAPALELAAEMAL